MNGWISAAPKPQTPVATPCNGETILITEDAEALRTLACRILQSHGYRVLEAKDGNDALALCERHTGPIDLLLTDVIMPAMSGKELAERLAKSRPGLKVLYMSGYTDSVIGQRGILEDGVSFVQKPFTRDALLTCIRDVLHGVRPRPERSPELTSDPQNLREADASARLRATSSVLTPSTSRGWWTRLAS